MGVGVGIFLMVLGAILAFAVRTDVPGINVNTLGVILLLIGLVAFFYSLLFWSAVTPWGRRRVNARRRVVGLEPPVELDEEPLTELEDVGAVYDALGTGVQGLLTGQSTVETVLKSMDTAWDQ